MKRSTGIWDTLLIASIVLIAGVCAQSQQAALADDAEPEGRIVQISPDDGVVEEEAAAEPRYWIGIQGRSIDSPVLRTHLQLAQDMGVVIEQVVPDSPAAKAGLRKHDILLRANGDGVDNMRVLQQHVLSGQDKPIELKIIRLGKEETIVVVPEQRPQRLDPPLGRAMPPLSRALAERLRGLDGGHEGLQRALEQLGVEGFAGGFRNFGPGIVINGQRPDMNSLPNGVSVSVRRDNDGPAQITVQQGDQTWKIVGDDPESLEQLPDEVRPFVERMLDGTGGFGQLGAMQFNFDQQLENLLPRQLGNARKQIGQVEKQIEQATRQQQRAQQMRRHEQELAKRMEQLEARLQEMQERLEREGPALDVQ